jgi:hypothetical protein
MPMALRGADVFATIPLLRHCSWAFLVRTSATLLVGDCLDVQLVEVDDFRRFLKFRPGTVAHSDDIQ